MHWKVRLEPRRILGTFEQDELRQKLQSGEIPWYAEVMRVGGRRYEPLDALPEFADLVAGAKDILQAREEAETKRLREELEAREQRRAQEQRDHLARMASVQAEHEVRMAAERQRRAEERAAFDRAHEERIAAIRQGAAQQKPQPQAARSTAERTEREWLQWKIGGVLAALVTVGLMLAARIINKTALAEQQAADRRWTEMQQKRTEIDVEQARQREMAGAKASKAREAWIAFDLMMPESKRTTEALDAALRAAQSAVDAEPKTDLDSSLYAQQGDAYRRRERDARRTTALAQPPETRAKLAADLLKKTGDEARCGFCASAFYIASLTEAERKVPAVAQTLALHKMRAAQELAKDQREADGGRGLLCGDGTTSPSCTCGGPRRGCCSHHKGVRGCEPAEKITEVSCRGCKEEPF